jgi:hypothetical protein
MKQFEEDLVRIISLILNANKNITVVLWSLKRERDFANVSDR